MEAGNTKSSESYYTWRIVFWKPTENTIHFQGRYDHNRGEPRFVNCSKCYGLLGNGSANTTFTSGRFIVETI
jgi:hypothetical protein